MSLSYLQPIDESFTLDDYKPQQVGFQLQKHLPSLGLPDLTDIKNSILLYRDDGAVVLPFSPAFVFTFLWAIGILVLQI